MTDASRWGPDLALGVDADILVDGKLAGHVGDDEVLLVRGDGGYFAVSAHCTHYNGPLCDGLVVGDTIRCPWHHTSFDLRSGEAQRAPAFLPIRRWAVECADNKVYVRNEIPPAPAARLTNDDVAQIVIVGGGAAGFAAAETLRRVGYGNGIAMVSTENAPPIDRPNLSKDYLAGNAAGDWLPLRPAAFYADARIDLRLGTTVNGINARAHRVVTSDGRELSYDRLLLATGAEPRRLSVAGAHLPHVRALRTLGDADAIIAGLAGVRRAVVVGAGFIGLEAAASLRMRGVDVRVVTPHAIPMERLLGAEMGTFLRTLHESHGVTFHFGDELVGIEERRVVLGSGTAIEAELVIVGIGVAPRTGLAEAAGLCVEDGIVVDDHLETSAPGVFAAGDVARWRDRRTGETRRIEHWAVAGRMGQAAALNMLGQRQVFDAVPFFWSQHYDVVINYVGHAADWDCIDIDGDIAARDCFIRYKRLGALLAAASIGRDMQSLRAELALEGGP